ncbi:MAG: hypothetical protein KKF85_14275 [Gammaproteobacteria bacterium]|nr:hypothetical protein [Rhodocyclaceae bacterium]MBU3909609.1 hypothetical protein [Gammaproteobacteria bacterium]MBU3989671.1 hypothetical protein [Gammaproteobacteria bacterium]MBU4005142.1 hypothetical protein [Gammaproteobacteria bacterium]MBU4022321.1 hypothetical protein [Gammaproteobacteria bacterium]
MNPVDLIAAALADGVELRLLNNGKLKALGDSAAIERWTGRLKEQKASIIESLKVGAGDTATSWGWLLHFPDRAPLPVLVVPHVTHAEILDQHPDAIAAEPYDPIQRHPIARMTGDEEQAIRAWLALIEETDPATIADVLNQCQQDADARDYFIGRAEAEVPIAS